MTDFLIWFYQGFNGFGGWIVFLALAVIGMILVYVHASVNRIPAVIWKVLQPLMIVCILPAVIYRFSGSEVRASLSGFTDAFFYLGVIGGTIGFLLAIGYLIGNWNVAAPETSQPISLNENQPQTFDAGIPTSAVNSIEFETSPMNFSGVNHWESNDAGTVAENYREKAKGWLVDSEGRIFQLYTGETSIGRVSENDIQLTERTIGRRHAKIVEENGHFKLFDLDSTNFTRVNGHIIKKPFLLEYEDEIQFGDEIKMIFKC